MKLRPEDIDFPISETFRMGLSKLHGWGYQGIDDYRTERERRFDDDLAAARRCKAETPKGIISQKKEGAKKQADRRTSRGDRPVRGL